MESIEHQTPNFLDHVNDINETQVKNRNNFFFTKINRWLDWCETKNIIQNSIYDSQTFYHIILIKIDKLYVPFCVYTSINMGYQRNYVLFCDFIDKTSTL